MPLNLRKSRANPSSIYNDGLTRRPSSSAVIENDQKKRYSTTNKYDPQRIRRNGWWIMGRIATSIINAKFLANFEAFMVVLGSLILLTHFMKEKTLISTISTISSASWKYEKANHIYVQRHPTRVTTRKRPDHNKKINIHLPSIPNRTLFKYAPQAKFLSPNPKYGLNINFLAEDSESWGRRIKIDQDELTGGHVYTESDYEKGWRNYENYYAFDDDIVRNEHFDDKKNHCRRVAWHRLYNPNCNTLHESELLPLGQKMDKNRFLGEGSYRAAFLQESPHDPELVMKVQRLKDYHYASDRYEFVRMDALIMERLTASPRIVDVYGHCAASVLTEFLPKELDYVAVPYQSRTRQQQIHEKQKQEMKVKPVNNLTMTERLDVSIQMAETIADLHGFKDGVIVHDDIQLPQFLFAEDGNIKLNDFNRGEVMLFNEKKNEYCRYRNGRGGGDWRAPEEYVDNPLDEKIDVFSYGNNVYSLLTGLFVFYEEKNYKKIKKMILNGKKAHIDDVYRSGGAIERKLVEIIEKCWTFDPTERPSIFEIIDDLQRFKKEL